MDIGKRAKELFETYSDAVGGVAVSGKPIPAWDDVGFSVQSGWMAVARASSPPSTEDGFLGGWQSTLTPRQKQQVAWAVMYDTEVYRHGANGHNDLMLISTLADKLDSYEDTINRLLESYREQRDK